MFPLKTEAGIIEMSGNKLNVKGILFDLDGTILDTAPAYIETGKLTFQAMGQKTPPNSTLLQIPKRIEQRQPLNGIIKEDTQSFLKQYIATFYKIASDNTKPLPHAAEILQQLSKRAKLAVITMRFMPKELILCELAQHGLASYFTSIVTALDTPKPKPSPEALTKALTGMDVQVCDCVVVGDSVVDITAGKAAGARTIAVLTGMYTREELSEVQPDYIINDITELPRLLA